MTSCNSFTDFKLAGNSCQKRASTGDPATPAAAAILSAMLLLLLPPLLLLVLLLLRALQ
jgi:hypothetical protein